MATQLNDSDIELLSQYIDGELPAAESRALEARLQNETALQNVLLKMQALNKQVADSLNERASVPGHIADLLSRPDADTESPTRDAKILAFPGSRGAAVAAPDRRWPYAIAASFVAVLAVTLIGDFGTTTSSLPGNDALVSAALNTQQSGEDWTTLEDGRQLQSVLTFPHEDGRWCREYLLRADADWRAVACRQGDTWVTQAAGLEAFLESADAYRPAGAGDSAPVAVFISQHAADIALGWRQEQSLIDSQWQ